MKVTTMGFWKQVGEYLYLRKKDPNEPRNFSIKMMHGINRLSLLMALIALIIVIIKLIRKA
ncbi:MAG: DUF6728 family protein [Pseudobacter sp.]|uniref:DUF6728 family protein n=1 Tax=Pseudobacter sp. TaxID=2045420 RepID=UPI003F80F86B